MIKLLLQPQPEQFPKRGGVAEHLRQLHFHLKDRVELVNMAEDADIIHVESSYPIPDNPNNAKIVYVCHGGFVPVPIPQVIDGLEKADIIISVAQWLIDSYFPQFKHKSVVIPNGIILSEFEHLPNGSNNYILYAKEWDYYFDDFRYLVQKLPDLQFVSTIWPRTKVPFNVKRVGLQSRANMKQILKKAGCLVLTGSEVCPTMMLEAWACGVPVVAKAIDGSMELFSNNRFKGGMVYRDKAELKACAEFALYKREELGQEGFEVAHNYQWSNLIDDYIRVYDEFT